MNELIVGGINLKNRFGVVATGVGIDNSPIRNIEYLEIDGRNGAVAIDKGNFLNIEITYDCYIAHNFSELFSALKAYLLSLHDYARIEDEYYPSIYRMGILSATVEPDVTTRRRGGKFELTFSCKPQRFLKVGEQPIKMQCGVTPEHKSFTIDNPTYYTSKPLYKLLSTAGISGTMAEVDVNGGKFEISYMHPMTEYFYDCETKILYEVVDGSRVIQTTVATVVGDVDLTSGTNTISIPSNFEIEVIPRWWSV